MEDCPVMSLTIRGCPDCPIYPDISLCDANHMGNVRFALFAPLTDLECPIYPDMSELPDCRG